MTKREHWEVDPVGYTLSVGETIYRMDHDPEYPPSLEKYLSWCRYQMSCSEYRPPWMDDNGTIDRSALDTIADCCEASQIDPTICPLCGLGKRHNEGECAECFYHDEIATSYGSRSE